MFRRDHYHFGLREVGVAAITLSQSSRCCTFQQRGLKKSRFNSASASLALVEFAREGSHIFDEVLWSFHGREVSAAFEFGPTFDVHMTLNE